jgi:carboxypeptidase Q
MRHLSRVALIALFTAVLSAGMAGSPEEALISFGSAAEEKVDLTVVERIRAEAFQNSRVMDHAFYLSEVYGPRLSGSPGFRAAGNWVVARLREYGLENIRKAPIPWGRGWVCTRFAVHLLKPGYAPLIGVPLAWSSSTRGRLTGEPLIVPSFPNRDSPTAAEDLQSFMREYRGKLKGKFLLMGQPRHLTIGTEPDSRRLTEQELAERANAPAPPAALAQPQARSAREGVEFQRALDRFLREEGALAFIAQGGGDSGTIFTTGSSLYRDWSIPPPIPGLALAAEQYGRIGRLVDRKIPVRLELELEGRFDETPGNTFNLIAELPGGRKKDEVVMIGAHLDSWDMATGATDNAAGCAMMIEAIRILKALDLKPLRTVRLALWGGHEGAGIGSPTYVREHFGDSDGPRPEHAKLAAYFNLDNGGGKIRGIYLPQRDEQVRPIFQAWLAPLKEMGATTIIPIGKPGGSDHVSFYEAGLLGFMFIQDPLDYRTRTHHSNMDLYDHLHAKDLQQAAAVVASFTYQAAMREELLPRKPPPNTGRQ